MFATLSMYRVKPAMRERMKTVADHAIPEVSNMKAFKGMTFMGDPKTDLYGGLALWETRESAEAAMAASTQQVENALADLLVAPPILRVLEVYEPK